MVFSPTLNAVGHPDLEISAIFIDRRIQEYECGQCEISGYIHSLYAGILPGMSNRVYSVATFHYRTVVDNI